MLELLRTRLQQSGLDNRCELASGAFPDVALQPVDYVIVMGVMDYVRDAEGLCSLRPLVRQSAAVSFPSKHWLRTPLRKVALRPAELPPLLLRRAADSDSGKARRLRRRRCLQDTRGGHGFPRRFAALNDELAWQTTARTSYFATHAMITHCFSMDVEGFCESMAELFPVPQGMISSRGELAEIERNVDETLAFLDCRTASREPSSCWESWPNFCRRSLRRLPKTATKSPRTASNSISLVQHVEIAGPRCDQSFAEASSGRVELAGRWFSSRPISRSTRKPSTFSI